MRLTLPESNRTRQRRGDGLTTSVLLHALLIGGAVLASAEARPRSAPAETLDTMLVYRTPRPAESPMPVARRSARVRESRTDTPAPAPQAPPIDVPTTIPPVDVPLPPIASTGPTDDFAAGSMTGDAVEGSVGAATNVVGMDGVHDALVVEHAATARSGNAVPAYPAGLRRQGVEGQVLVRFVVDTSGRVERTSLQVLHADHPGFAEAVRQVLPRHRFAPARLGGRAVRQLVEQRFVFALDR